MQIATLTIASLSLAVSITTLAVVVVGGLRAKDEVDQLRKKTNGSLAKVKAALDGLEV